MLHSVASDGTWNEGTARRCPMATRQLYATSLYKSICLKRCDNLESRVKACDGISQATPRRSGSKASHPLLLPALVSEQMWLPDLLLILVMPKMGFSSLPQ